MTQASGATTPPKITVTYLTGELKLEPVVYRYFDQGDGTGWIETDYCRFGGGPHADLLDFCRSAGIEVVGVPDVLSAGPVKRPWWWRWL
jgi:hypothetical protein